MPADDFKASCYFDNYYSWAESKKGIIKRPYWSVFEDDGDVKTEEDDGSYNDDSLKWRVDKTQKYKYCTILHTTGFQTYIIEVKETIRIDLCTGNRSVSYFMIIRGSFKTNHLKGGNCGRLTFDDLQEQIKLIVEVLGVDAEKIKIENLAPSILVSLPFPVYEFLKDSLISYRGNAFKQYDPDENGTVIGYHCPLGQVEVKLYDKSLQYNLPSYLMQFEDRFCKMQRLKNLVGIVHLSDLKDHSKVEKLIDILIQTWDDILLFDNSIDENNPILNARQREMVKYGDNPKYWEKLKAKCTSSTYTNRIAEFRSLSTDHGGNYHQNIRNLIIAEWNIISKSWQKLPSVKKRELAKITSSVRGKFNQVYYNGVKDCNTNNSNNINMTKGLSKPEHKSKKQLAKEKREKANEQVVRFMVALSTTLQIIQKKAA
ncbi:MAG: hypothetical protein CFE25_17145 [Chitinophagaceae bacterium BSSC1]|nr:MAG: hypothetical protein CFE25_17145 [Chitinophagaceae bacterium BSSC1]